MTTEQLPEGWRWRAGRAGPDYWQAERLADSMITACAYNAAYCISNARMLDVAAPVRQRSHMPVMPAEGWPADLLDAGFVQHPNMAHWLTLLATTNGLTIAGNDREHTITQARRYLHQVKLSAEARAAEAQRQTAKATKRTKKAKAASATLAAPAQMELAL